MKEKSEQSMFCYQCEQTMGQKCCTAKAGICGKTNEVANLQDELIGSLISLASICGKKTNDTEKSLIFIKGLFMTLTNVNFDAENIKTHTELIRKEKYNLCKKYNYDINEYPDYHMSELWANEPDEDIKSLKSLLLFGLKGMAAYAYHAHVLGYYDEEVNNFFALGLNELYGNDAAFLLNTLMDFGKVNLKCMELLDRANNDKFGSPVPVTVSMKIEKGPFIVISGHDLYDLELLLQQTEGLGINIYTHGEMLPAHGYPNLKKYNHLKGNFGTAWQNQQKEFNGIPAPVLFTTNCIMPPLSNYRDRVFTTEVVSYPGLVHIGDEKDFTPVIKRALELGGYESEVQQHGVNGGETMMTGFAHKTVLSVADKVIEAIKKGDLRHIFLIGGCDGSKSGRSYYTDFAKEAPSDTLILTLACGKYRINDLQIGSIGGIPRILDMGQCNDAYSAVKVASALAEAFNCGVNDLPLTLILSWYEQKAVCILLTLLALGIKNIYLGPTLPAFISPNILKYLVDNYNISAIKTPAEDLKTILG